MDKAKVNKILTKHGVDGIITIRKDILGEQMVLRHNNIEYIIKTERGLLDIVEGII